MISIRNSAKAIIIEGGKLLAVKLVDKDGYWYTLPGGGQEPNEPIDQTVRRECLEEISAEVIVKELRFVCDHAGEDDLYPFTYGPVHVVEFIFVCSLPKGAAVRPGAEPDTHSVGLEWLEIAKLDSYRLYPIGLRALVEGCEDPGIGVYVGEGRPATGGVKRKA